MLHDIVYWNSNTYSDRRGIFKKIIDLEQTPQIKKFEVNDFFITTSKPMVIRGMHLMINEDANNRIIHVYEGIINDVVMDLRTGESSFLKISSKELGNSALFDTIFVPAGIAHGFSTKVGAKIIYLSDRAHNSKNDLGFNPLSFGYDWEIENPILSDRDSSSPFLSEIIK